MKANKLGLSIGLALLGSAFASANLLANGDLDVKYNQEIVSGFFLPKPDGWMNVGMRAISGAYEDEMSSEPWAGPAPTPLTTNGKNVTTGDVTNDDWGVFFKPFSGNTTDGAATGHLYQDTAALGGTTYTLTGWAGGEANVMMENAVFALDFFDGSGGPLGGSQLSLMPTLTTANGEAFSYKLYSLSALAPTGTTVVRSRVSMINGMSNPNGGGQAFVVDDFVLTESVPEPATMTVLAIGGLAALARKRRSSR